MAAATKHKAFLGINKSEMLWKQLYNDAIGGSESAQRIIADRLWPKARQLDMVEFDFDRTQPITDQAGQLLDAVSKGQLDVTSAAKLIGSIASMQKIKETDELESIVKDLEKELKVKR